MEEKSVWAVAGAGLGWLLSVGTGVIKEKIRIHRLAVGMKEELIDIKTQVGNVIETLKRDLQMVGARCMGPSGIYPVHHIFFEQAYKEVFPDLSQAKRLSYQMIHSAVESLNQQNAALDALYLKLSDAQAPEQSKKDHAIELWAEKVKAAYGNAHDILWYIDAHLKELNGNVVAMYGPEHEAWLKNRCKVEEDAARYIETGTKIKPSWFNKTHDPATFSAPARTNLDR